MSLGRLELQRTGGFPEAVNSTLAFQQAHDLGVLGVFTVSFIRRGSPQLADMLDQPLGDISAACEFIESRSDGRPLQRRKVGLGQSLVFAGARQKAARVIKHLDLVARLQKLAFDVQELLEQAGTVFVQGKHALIHGGNSQRRRNRAAVRVGDGEIELGHLARPIDGPGQSGGDLQPRSGIDVNDARTPSVFTGLGNQIRVHFERANERGRKGERIRGLVIFEGDRLSQDGLVVLDHVNENGVLLFGRDDGDPRALASLINGFVAAEQKGRRRPVRIGTVSRPGSSAARVGGLNVYLPIGILKSELDLADTLRITLVGGSVNEHPAHGGAPVRVGRQHVKKILDAGHQRARLGNRSELKLASGNGQGQGGFFDLLGRVAEFGFQVQESLFVLLRHPGEKVRQRDLERVFAVAAGSALQFGDHDRLFLKRGGGQPDRAAADGPAEEVIGLN